MEINYLAQVCFVFDYTLVGQYKYFKKEQLYNINFVDKAHITKSNIIHDVEKCNKINNHKCFNSYFTVNVRKLYYVYCLSFIYRLYLLNWMTNH